jgi:N-acylneuraminate cytidylyltransferase
VVQLRPTSPVRLTGMIDTCIQKMLNEPQADSLRIITPSPITPYKMWTMESENKPMQPLMPSPGIDEFYNQPRQILPQTYWQIGALDVIKTSVITTDKKMSGKMVLPYVLDNVFAVDIDDIASFDKAAAVITEHNCIKFK